MSEVLPIAILGAGSWGTALAILIARNSHPVRLWGRGDYVQQMALSRCNKQYLPDVILPELVTVFDDFHVAVDGVRDVLIAVPSYAFRPVVTMLQHFRPQHIRLSWVSKGLDPCKHQLLHEVILETYPQPMPMAVIAGPSFAKEVAMGLPTAVTITCNDLDFEQYLIEQLHNHYFRVYQQPDFIGVQVCGAVKNALAVATGICDGLGFGANARAALITRGLAEMVRFGKEMGAQQETFMGLAGVGDLVLSCTDDKSRNRRFGFAVGKGVPVDLAEKNIGQVVEGKSNALMVRAVAESLGVEMPIIEQVCHVIQQTVTPHQAVEALLAREQRQELL